MLVVHLPDNCRLERRWICSVLLGEFLGLVHDLQFDGERSVRIHAAGKTLEISDHFFSGAKDRWLCNESQPAEPLQRWTVADSGLDPALAFASVPVLFGAGGFTIDSVTKAVLELDVFGAAFFMLSRYEEAFSKQRDNHDRFPASACLAYREEFLDRPLIDEYVEILWAAMQRLWPQLHRKPRQFKTVVTCDVDHPYHPSAASIPRLIKRTAGEVMRMRTLASALSPYRNYISSKSGDWRNDPYYHTVDWMMDVNEQAGNTVSFYFIPEITDTQMDDTRPITDPAVTAMMKRISDRGHAIGIHPGYQTYQNEANFNSGLKKLQEVLSQQKIGQKIAGGRQHYLRWSIQTPAIWDAAELEYDSTLSYVNRAGFRCGTCHEYTMFDLRRRKALKVRQRPLICMESSVINLMGYGLTDAALAEMEKLKTVSRKFNGNFILLWHNSFFPNEEARQIYRKIITS